jgi:hypothetical protein
LQEASRGDTAEYEPCEDCLKRVKTWRIAADHTPVAGSCYELDERTHDDENRTEVRGKAIDREWRWASIVGGRLAVPRAFGPEPDEDKQRADEADERKRDIAGRREFANEGVEVGSAETASRARSRRVEREREGEESHCHPQWSGSSLPEAVEADTKLHIAA